MTMGVDTEGIRIVKLRSIGAGMLGTPPPRGEGETLVTPLSALPGMNSRHLMSRGPVAHHFIELTASNGMTGYGIVGAFDGAVDFIVRNHLAHYVLGQNPFDSNLIWEGMYRATAGYGRKGIVLSGISAIDIAVWDLKAKILGVSLADLIGGTVRGTIPAYASRMYGSTDIDAVVREALSYQAQGFRAMKMRFGYGPESGVRGLEHNISQLRAVREAVGPDTLLMADVYMGWDSPYTVRALPRLAELGLYWLEEPLSPDDLAGMARLRSIANSHGVLISGGEHEYTHFGVRSVLEAGSVDLLQVDVNRVGGITEALKCWSLASAFGTPVIPHSGQLHNLHLVAAHANSLMVEYFPDAAGAPDRNELYQRYWRGDPQAVDGEITLPRGSGVGIEPVWDLINEHLSLDETVEI